jgi:ribosomal protein L44E|tara:strand:+ start:378 stop:650 length:273 start_codon:yes stop_codon:yes gene_type:complete
MNRKQRRAQEKKMGKENSQKLAEKIFQFDQLPEECLTCKKEFDKKSKEMAMTWSVVVQDPETVRLYCPDCWKTALKLIEDLKERFGSDDG